MRKLICSALLAFSATLLAQQPLPPEPRTPALLLGAAWYPEQWPESRWEADLSLMERAHIHLVRVGEFAWSTMEPSEGNFQLDWLDQAIRAAEKHHIAVVLGTPGAAPPAWLTQKYPETLRTMENGRKGPPSLRVSNKLSQVLDLTEVERRDLWLTGLQSKKT